MREGGSAHRRGAARAPAIGAAIAFSFCALSAKGATGADSASDLRAVLAPPPGARVMLDAPERAEVYAAPVRPAAPGVSPLDAVEGLATWRSFALEQGGATLPLARRWRAALEALGFETLLDCAGAECGGFAFRAALRLAPPPDMVVNLADFHQLTLRGPDGAGGEALVSALLSSLGGRLHGQVVTVRLGGAAAAGDTGGEGAAGGTLAPGASRTPSPAPFAAPGPALSVADGGDLGIGSALDAQGHAAIEGLAFLSGAAGLADPAAPALDAAATALRARPGLSVAIVGHTDASGALEANLAVSRARAEAVRQALIARGVAAERLSVEGVGWLAPRASNATEAGRAANRRVELVAR